jgi:hypothetical protein
MKIQRLLVVLTVLNLGLLVFLAGHLPTAAAEGDAPMLRGRGLQIVDERGRVRASIIVHPAGSAAGMTYPETVMLRLVDPNGRPEVKIGASVEGGAVGLVGQADTIQASLTATRDEARLKLQDNDGRAFILKPN